MASTTPLTSAAASTTSYTTAGGAGAGAGAGAGGIATPIPKTMRAVYYTRNGNNSVLQSGTRPVPTLGDNDVLVRVHAAALNPVDYKARSGSMVALLMGKPSTSKPTGLGFDVSGQVVAVGPKVAGGWGVGDEVFCMSNNMGAVADYVAVHEGVLALKPKNLTHEQAAGIPLAGLTALQSLDRADICDGDRVIITAGSGGVGSIAIQLAKYRNAFVATTCSPPKADLLKSLGADMTVNYRAGPLDRTLASEKKFDGAVDCTHEVSRLLRVLRRGGIVASITTLPSGDNLPKIAKGYHKPEFCCCLPRCIACLGFCGSCCKPGVCCDKKRVEGVLTIPDGKDLAKLAALYEEGHVKPVIDRTFTFDEARDAVAHLEKGRATGKVVITVHNGAANKD